jgi:hypothetical protein
MREISVNIERLVLDEFGLQSQNGDRLGPMTEAALQRLLEQQGFPSVWAPSHVAEVSAPSIRLPPSATDAQVADEVALAVYRALGEMR